MNLDNSLLQKINLQAKMILLDLDGTLLGHSGELEPALQDALLALRDRRPSLPLIVCTGRPYGGVAAHVASLLGDAHTPHIFHGGALTRSLMHTLHAEAIAPEQLLALLDQSARLPNFSLELYTPDAIFVARSSPLDLAHARALGMTHTATDLRALTLATPIIKAQWILPDTHLDTLRATYLDACAYSEATSDVMPGTAFVTVTRHGIDKGSALRHLLHARSIDAAHVVAIGDSGGDLPMLDAVGFPFIMKNAPSHLHTRYPTLPHIDAEGIIPLLDALR